MKPDYILPSSDEESERLGRQARLYGGVEVLRRLLDTRPARILDAGCGAGHFSLELARQCPFAELVGIERDPGRLDFARAHAAAPNLRFEAGDLHALPLDEDRFDLALCRFVLVHDQDPLAALRELARVTRPGGTVVAYDMVHEGIWFAPERPAFARLLARVCAILREQGAEPNQGLYLATGMIRAGLEQVRAQVIPHQAFGADPLLEAYRENWIATVSSLEASLGARFEPGLAEAARAELERRTDGELIVEITVLAEGRKPG